jgi:hypothetical protein
MPTDGADFGRMRACYGKAFSAARAGADNGDVAEMVARGLERDIRWAGGLPAFLPAIDLLVLVSQYPDASRRSQLLHDVERLARNYADSPLTRHVADAAARIGLKSINEGRALSRASAAEMMLSDLGKSLCCDCLTPYLTRNLTQSTKWSAQITASIAEKLPATNALKDLVSRMLKASPSGLPAKAQKAPPIEHSADALNSITLEGGL